MKALIPRIVSAIDSAMTIITPLFLMWLVMQGGVSQEGIERAFAFLTVFNTAFLFFVLWVLRRTDKLLDHCWESHIDLSLRMNKRLEEIRVELRESARNALAKADGGGR